jgi:diadenosine tetraphosphatase ApaH/serine/threonine PP2A family protein phosphatase
MIVLLTLKCLYPRRYYLIRGNHEFACINADYGFKEEVDSRYPGSTLWDDFNEVFSIFPLAILLGRTYVCLHGGIGPSVPGIQTIRKVTLPLYSYENQPAVCELVWSDPTDTTARFLASPRGSGYVFGAVALMQFLQNSKCRTMLRAHQTLQHGLGKFGNGQGFTVFSNSNYMGTGNSGAFLHITEDSEMDPHPLDPLPEAVERTQAVYSPVVPIVKSSRIAVQEWARLGMVRARSLQSYKKSPKTPEAVVPMRPAASDWRGMRRMSLKGLAALPIPLKALTPPAIREESSLENPSKR